MLNAWRGLAKLENVQRMDGRLSDLSAVAVAAAAINAIIEPVFLLCS